MMTAKMKKSALAATALATTAGIGSGLTAPARRRASLPVPSTPPRWKRAAAPMRVTNCMTCHGDNLSGEGEAPPLAGRAFLAPPATHGQHQGVVRHHQGGDALGAPGSLSDETYTDLVAFILHANGAKTGTSALTPTDVKLSSVANGTLPPDVLPVASGPERRRRRVPHKGLRRRRLLPPPRPSLWSNSRALPRGANGSPILPGQGGGGPTRRRSARRIYRRGCGHGR